MVGSKKSGNREKLLNETEEKLNPHVILPQDPLYSVYSNGQIYIYIYMPSRGTLVF